MTNNPSPQKGFGPLDPDEADRKYAEIAIACIEILKGQTLLVGTSLTEPDAPIEILGRMTGGYVFLSDLEETIQWLEDNSQ